MKISNRFFHIPGFSRYTISKNGTLKDTMTGTVTPASVVKRCDLYLRNDSNKVICVDIIYLLSQMTYGPNNFPILELEDDLILSDDFTAEDIKVDLLSCLKTFRYISEYEFEMCGVVFRKYADTPLYITKYGNIFNAATGMILKLPQRNGYYTLTAFYGGLRVQRMVYETWKDYFPDDYHIDHLNCRPWDNYVENLEPVTSGENTRRAIRNSLKDYNMNWETAESMCKDLAYPHPMSPQAVSEKYNVPIHVPRFIVQGLTWNEITNKYGLIYPDYNLRKKTEVTSEMMSDAGNGMTIEEFSEKYHFGGRKLKMMYKQSF